MRILHYIEIENFKAFGEKQRIELDHPTVLIGPNNSGKTTIIQAIALWSQAVKTWQDELERSDFQPFVSGEINRLAVVVPVQKTRFLWHDARTNEGKPILIAITVGLAWAGAVRPLTVRLRHWSDETISCEGVFEHDKPAEAELIAAAAGLDIHLLYSMSGLPLEEPLYQRAYLDTLLGQGRTGEALRNLCLLAHSHDPARWDQIAALMFRLFNVRLSTPVVNARGLIDISYQQDDVQGRLDLATTGRGFLQMLLILAYLHSREGGVLLIDEPDAHFEVLRQQQVYVLLRDLANQTGMQVALVTHSESILEHGVNRNVSLVRGANVENVAKRKDIEDALKFYGARNYVKARTAGHVLYVEGATDVDMLRALSSRMGHPVAAVWDERANVYFVQDNYPGETMDSALERVEGGFGVTPEKHFFALYGMVPSLRGLAILDNDGKRRVDSDAGGLRTVYWSRYEAENYFVTPELLVAWVDAHDGASGQAGLFEQSTSAIARRIVDTLTAERVFPRPQEFAIYQQTTGPARALLWSRAAATIKLSDFAEEFFRRLAAETQTPMLLRKGELHQLVAMVEPATIASEVGEKLDLLLDLWR